MVLIQSKKIVAAGNEFHFGAAFAENGVFIVLEVEGSENHHASTLGKEIVDTILTQYTDYQERDLSVVSALLDSFTEKLSIKTLLIGLQKGSQLFIGCKGTGEVRIQRGGKMGNLLSGEELVSGEIKPNDRILFYSDTFSQFISQEDREALLTSEHFDENVERIDQTITQKTELQGAVALVLSVLLPEAKQLARVRQRISFLFEKGKEIIAKRQNAVATFTKRKESRSKKMLLTISGILVILLIASIFFNVNNTRRTMQEKKLREVFTLISHQYEEAVSLFELNPARARSLLSDSKLTLSPFLAGVGKNSNEYKDITEWLNKIAEQEVAAYKIYKLTSVPVFFDIQLVKNGGEGELLASYKEKKVILDTKNQVVYSLSTDKKQAVVLAGSETVKDAKSITIHGNTAYVVTNEGVVGIDIPTKSAKVVIKRDEQWGEIGAVSAFGGNVYLLDKTKNTIWKYIATDFGFSSRTTYLNPDVRVNFTDSKKLVIDGSVWVLFDRELLKFTRGLGEEFAFTGFSDSIQQIKTISTSDEEKNLYLLDPGLSRIIVFDKDGAYQAQYQWDELANAKDIVVSEAEKKIFILVGSKIYGIDMK